MNGRTPFKEKRILVKKRLKSQAGKSIIAMLTMLSLAMMVLLRTPGSQDISAVFIRDVPKTIRMRWHMPKHIPTMWQLKARSQKLVHRDSLGKEDLSTLQEIDHRLNEMLYEDH